MFAKVKIKGLDEAEAAALEILEHVEAIKKLMPVSAFGGLSVEVEINTGADSGN